MKKKKETLKKIHVNLNPYYKNLVDHPEQISERFEGESITSIVRMGIDALVSQENRLNKEKQNEEGAREKAGE